MASAVNFDHLSARIERGQRKAVARTIVLSVATLAIAGIVLFFTLRQIEEARGQLATVNSQIEAANAAKLKAESSFKAAQADLAKTQDSLKSVEANAGKLTQQVSALEGKLAAAQKALAEQQKALADSQAALAEAKTALASALDLDKYIYKLNWGEMKMMFVEFGRAAPILETISNYKSRVHWGMSNTAAGGYNSPGFATLIMQQMHKVPANGSLASLPRDNGPPQIGDIVVYESGYHLFYFRDHEQKEFVVGMTPFGVTALNYDFGNKRVGVIRTGFAQH